MVQNRMHRESNQLHLINVVNSPRYPDIFRWTVYCLFWPKCDLGVSWLDFKYSQMGKWSRILAFLENRLKFRTTVF